jgi:hypothetical protein
MEPTEPLISLADCERAAEADRAISGRRERDIRSALRSTRADLVPGAKLAGAGGDMAPMDFVSLRSTAASLPPRRG